MARHPQNVRMLRQEMQMGARWKGAELGLGDKGQQCLESLGQGQQAFCAAAKGHGASSLGVEGLLYAIHGA